jgi:hypothetical protein
MNKSEWYTNKWHAGYTSAHIAAQIAMDETLYFVFVMLFGQIVPDTIISKYWGITFEAAIPI